MLKWPLNAIVGILVFHTFAIQNVHLGVFAFYLTMPMIVTHAGFVSGAQSVADLKTQRYSYKKV